MPALTNRRVDGVETFKRNKENQRQFAATKRTLAVGAILFIVVIGVIIFELATTISSSLSSASSSISSASASGPPTLPAGIDLECGYTSEVYSCTTITESNFAATKTVTVISSAPGGTSTVSECSTTVTITSTSTPLGFTPSRTVTSTATSVSYGHTSTTTGCFAYFVTQTITTTKQIQTTSK
jgi:hypothetical protein